MSNRPVAIPLESDSVAPLPIFGTDLERWKAEREAAEGYLTVDPWGNVVIHYGFGVTPKVALLAHFGSNTAAVKVLTEAGYHMKIRSDGFIYTPSAE